MNEWCCYYWRCSNRLREVRHPAGGHGAVDWQGSRANSGLVPTLFCGQNPGPGVSRAGQIHPFESQEIAEQFLLVVVVVIVVAACC